VDCDDELELLLLDDREETLDDDELDWLDTLLKLDQLDDD